MIIVDKKLEVRGGFMVNRIILTYILLTSFVYSSTSQESSEESELFNFLNGCERKWTTVRSCDLDLALELEYCNNYFHTLNLDLDLDSENPMSVGIHFDFDPQNQGARIREILNKNPETCQSPLSREIDYQNMEEGCSEIKQYGRRDIISFSVALNITKPISDILNSKIEYFDFQNPKSRLIINNCNRLLRNKKYFHNNYTRYARHEICRMKGQTQDDEITTRLKEKKVSFYESYSDFKKLENLCIALPTTDRSDISRGQRETREATPPSPSTEETSNTSEQQ